jgi:uncharacterized membrane protein YdbT with pleckstrin-like domain
MRYAERVLQPGEVILYDRKIWNPRLLIRAVIYGLLAFFIISSVKSIPLSILRDELEDFSNALSLPPPGLNIRMAVFAIGALFVLSAVWALIRSGSKEITITDRRIIDTRGIVRRAITEMPIYHLDSVRITQSPLGRIFGYGKVTFRSTGGTRLPLELSRPVIFMEHIPINKPNA